MVDTHHTSTIGWRSVLLASAVSILGDQLAKVALSVLVFNRTGSAALTAITFGLTLVPELLGGVTLGGLADRYPRRTVMVACAATQATLVAVMALPGMPFVVLAVAVAGVSALAAPARAAQNAVAFELLGPDRFSAGQALLTMLSESGQLLGLAVGAGVVAAVGTSGALVGDAVSFAGAALVLWFGMAATTNPASARTAPPHPEDTTRGGTRTAWRTIRADPTLRIMSWLVTLVALGAVPSGIMAGGGGLGCQADPGTPARRLDRSADSGHVRAAGVLLPDARPRRCGGPVGGVWRRPGVPALDQRRLRRTHQRTRTGSCNVGLRARRCQHARRAGRCRDGRRRGGTADRFPGPDNRRCRCARAGAGRDGGLALAHDPRTPHDHVGYR